MQLRAPMLRALQDACPALVSTAKHLQGFPSKPALLQSLFPKPGASVAQNRGDTLGGTVAVVMGPRRDSEAPGDSGEQQPPVILVTGSCGLARVSCWHSTSMRLFRLAGKGDFGLIHETFSTLFSLSLGHGAPPRLAWLPQAGGPPCTPAGRLRRRRSAGRRVVTAQTHCWDYLPRPCLPCVQSHVRSHQGRSVPKAPARQSRPLPQQLRPALPTAAPRPWYCVPKHTGVN